MHRANFDVEQARRLLVRVAELGNAERLPLFPIHVRKSPGR
jgi:hypothetical protein